MVAPKRLTLKFAHFLGLILSLLSKTMAETIIEQDFSALGPRLASMLEKYANETIKTEEFFKIGVSGKIGFFDFFVHFNLLIY